MNPIRKSGVFLLLKIKVMAKGTEKSKERIVKKLKEQLVQFRNNPERLRRVQGKLATAENSN